MLSRIWLALGILVTTSSWAVVPEPPDYWTGEINSPVPDKITGGKVIHARKLAALLKDSHPVVVDVSNAPRRPENMAPAAPWLPLPHQGIPGAIWIPGAGLGEAPAPIEEFYRERLAAATGHNLTRALVIYCHKRCWLSWNGARRAISYGYRNVYWFPDGIEGWRGAQLPTETLAPQMAP